MEKIIKIPKSRIAVLIGEKGFTKRKIQDCTKTKIIVSDEEISIDGEGINIMDAENIVKAIGRGFSPENAFELLEENKTMLQIPLPEDRKILKRIKSRLIGTGGKARRNIERLTNTHVSIFGKTVSIIGDYENAECAFQAIEKLIKGYSHKSVYSFLEKR